MTAHVKLALCRAKGLLIICVCRVLASQQPKQLEPLQKQSIVHFPVHCIALCLLSRLTSVGCLLQEHYVQVNSNWTRDVWAGAADTEEWKQWPAVKARFPVEAAKIPWEQYRHYASLVRSLPCCFSRSMGPLHDLQ